MTSPETYTAELRDRPFGPIIERLEKLRLVDRRPDPVLRRHAEHEGRRWVKVYDLELGVERRHVFSYLLSYEGPEFEDAPASAIYGGGR